MNKISLDLCKISLDLVQFFVVVQFSFTTRESELDYCHQKVIVGVASLGTELLKMDLKKLGNIKKIPQNTWN